MRAQNTVLLAIIYLLIELYKNLWLTQMVVSFVLLKFFHDYEAWSRLIYIWHSRNGFGLIDPNGKSLLMQLRDINHLYEYCCIMVHSVVPESQWFEVTNVNVHECSEYQLRYHLSATNDKMGNVENSHFWKPLSCHENVWK